MKLGDIIVHLVLRDSLSSGEYKEMLTFLNVGAGLEYKIQKQHDFGDNSDCKNCGSYGPYEGHLPCISVVHT